MNNDLTFLIVSYDGYSDMWNTFFECKEKYWNDCPYEFVLANNTIEYVRRDVRVINCGKDAQWSTRTRMGLEAINTQYVCFLLEDFFISEDVDNQKIERAVKIMRDNGINYYKLMSLSKIRTPYFDKANKIRTIPANLKYGISLLAAIWERQHFLSLIGPEDYNPWKFEIDRNVDVDNSRDDKSLVGVYDERNLLNICHMVVQGKYLPSAVSTMTKKGIIISTDKRGIHSTFFEKKNTLKDTFFPILRKSKLAGFIANIIGIETVTNKNK